MFNHADALLVPTTAFYSQSQNTSHIVAPQNYSTTEGGGYILLEITGLRSDFMDDKQERSAVIGTISRQYTQSGWITSWGGGSVELVNNSGKYIMSSLGVRLLDPATKKPLSNSSLGTASSIFIEIVEPLQKLPKAIQDKKKEETGEN
jgi:hypothetical protein